MKILFFAALAVGIYHLVKNNKSAATGKNEALEVLKKRYINNEIDDETYLKMKETIKK